MNTLIRKRILNFIYIITTNNPAIKKTQSNVKFYSEQSEGLVGVKSDFSPSIVLTVKTHQNRAVSSRPNNI